MMTTSRAASPQALYSQFYGQTLTRDFSEMLVLGPFHWIITLPRSNRKMSPLLKLFQDKVTFQSQERGVEGKGVRPPEPKAGEGEGMGMGKAGCVACMREVVCSCVCVCEAASRLASS